MIKLVVPLSLPSNEKEDVTARLLTVFKQLIAEGKLTPEGRFPPERELAETLGVSRSSLRQALKVLEIMGVISQRVGDGTYLNSAASSVLGEPMEFLILLGGISFHELMEARLIVEPELAARAATRASDDDVAAIQRELKAMEESLTLHDRFVRHDLLFHRAIFAAAGNRVCGQMFSVVLESLEELITVTSQRVDAAHTLMLHRRIYQAIRKRDADDARRRMIDHLLDARDLLTRTAESQDKARLKSSAGILKQEHPE